MPQAGIALVLILLVPACTGSVSRATATPGPTATATPTSVPTIVPTVAPMKSPPPTVPPATSPPTLGPRPTSRTAGEQLLPYYFAARRIFPLLPSAPEIELDEPADTDGNAWYHGLSPTGAPRFAVRQDFVMTAHTAYHEIGHAYEDMLRRRDPSTDFRARYWTFRGFPGTWQEAAASAATRTGMEQWITSPNESWAEAFAIAVIGSGRERTLDYGRTIDASVMRAFFISLANGL